MGSPSSTLATLRPDLGSFMEFDLAASRAGFIGLSVLPVLNVPKQSSPFGKITLESMLQQRDTKRAPGGGYNRARFEFDADSYSCEEHGAEEPVDDREAEMYSEYFEAESLAALRARDIVLRNYEQRVASLVFDSGSYTPTGVSTEWSTASAVPLTDVETQVQALFALGVKANALVITWNVFRNLRNCTQILDRITASGAGGQIEPDKITPAKLAELFDLKYVLVGDAQKNTAQEGQTASLSTIWDDEYAAIMRIPETRDIREPCFGRTFHWSADGSQIGGTMESYRDETVRSDVIRCRMDTDEKVLYTSAIKLLSNITA